MNARALSLCLIAVAASGLCCKSRAAASAQAQPADGSAPLATMNGVTITAREVDAKVKAKVLELEQQIYQARRDALDELVSEKLIELEAKARGVSKEEYLRAELQSRITAPSDAEIAKVYEENKARFGGKTLAEMKPRIVEYLRNQAAQDRGTALRAELEAKHNVKVLMTAPRFEVSPPATAYAKGPAKAPVTIVEFSDYQCPYCQRAEKTVEGLLGKYGERVRFVLVDYPIEGHPGAFPASRAARCAGDQGKFWEYHQHLLTEPGAFTEEDFKGRAASLGLKGDEFGACFASGKHDPAINAGREQGNQLGVTATPTFFINGRMISGAREARAFETIIDEELAQ